jgi:probable HAF family extracellular repeat protein
MQDLGVIGGGPGGLNIGSTANGINEAGQVVGLGSVPGGNRAFLWHAVGGMQDLGDLPGGIDDSVALGINNVGQVVGYSGDEAGTQAFLWDAVGGMQNLGDLSVERVRSVAYGINDAGQVVGESAPNGGGGNRAFLWDAVDGMQDLNDLIDPGLSAVLVQAFAINMSGQIVGSAVTDGVLQAFLLTPTTADVPIPAALPLMLGGLGLLAGVARKRRAA